MARVGKKDLTSLLGAAYFPLRGIQINKGWTNQPLKEAQVISPPEPLLEKVN